MSRNSQGGGGGGGRGNCLMHNRRFMSQASRTVAFSAKRETRGGEKNKAPVASPLSGVCKRRKQTADGGRRKIINK